MVKRLCLIASVFAIFIAVAGCSNQPKTDDMDINLSLKTETPYPMNKLGCVDESYAQEILMKKSAGLELSEAESGLIDYYFLEEDKGMAIVDMHGIGMQKVVLKIFSTRDAGKTWRLIKDDYFVSVGYMDCIFLGDRLLISNYAAASEKTNMFFVDIDGEETHMSEDFFEKHEFDNFRLQAKPTYLPEKKCIVCYWAEDYDFDNVKHTTFYDEYMNPIEKTKGGNP